MIPPRVVLAAVDFSESSRVALVFAARLAAQCSAALHVLHAEEPLLLAAATARGIDLIEETRAELITFARSAAPAAERAAAYHVVAGPAATVISDLALREQADVLVVGMRGISAAEHLMFGSTTENLLRTASVSVFAVPGHWTPPKPDSPGLDGVGPVIAAVELSEPALEAAKAAVRLAEALHTSVEAIHVVPAVRVLNRWQATADAVLREREAAARRDLERALAGLHAGPIPLRVETGHVAQRIAAAAAPTAGRHPVLVMGRRPSASGATAYRILSLASAPVLQHAHEE